MKLNFCDAFRYSSLDPSMSGRTAEPRASYLLEIAVFNIQSALIAAAAGADRIELCENAADGGTTPSYGNLKVAKEKISIPVFPIIRPRGGDFFFTHDEFRIMQKDIELCKQLGFEGVV